MLNRYGWWQWLIIVGVIVPGIFFAFPNVFGDDPGIQVRGSRGTALSSVDFDRLKALVAEPASGLIRGSLDEKGASFRFSTPEAQLKARDLFESELKDRYTIALTLLPAAPAWFESMSARPMYLGLDLRGGVHFLMEVDMDQGRYADVIERGKEVLTINPKDYAASVMTARAYLLSKKPEQAAPLLEPRT